MQERKSHLQRLMKFYRKCVLILFIPLGAFSGIIIISALSYKIFAQCIFANNKNLPKRMSYSQKTQLIFNSLESFTLSAKTSNKLRVLKMPVTESINLMPLVEAVEVVTIKNHQKTSNDNKSDKIENELRDVSIKKCAIKNII